MPKLQAVLLKQGADFINLTQKFSHNCAYVYSAEQVNISSENQLSYNMKSVTPTHTLESIYSWLNSHSRLFLEMLTVAQVVNTFPTRFEPEVANNFYITPLKTKRSLLYLKTQFVPRSKHFSYRL